MRHVLSTQTQTSTSYIPLAPQDVLRSLSTNPEGIRNSQAKKAKRALPVAKDVGAGLKGLKEDAVVPDGVVQCVCGKWIDNWATREELSAALGVHRTTGKCSKYVSDNAHDN